MLHILNSQNTVLNKFVAEIRDKSIQKDSMRFRRNLERIGEVMAYEISKTFEYAVKVVETCWKPPPKASRTPMSW